jgi:hypothetical protein
MRRALIIAIALALVVPSPLGGTARAENARASPSYPAPPVATTSVAISKETIDTAYRTQNPLHSFLEKNQGHYTLFPRATIIPPGGWSVEWPDVAFAAPEKYFVSWSKVSGGRFWAVDCVTQRAVEIVGNTSIDLSCQRFAVMANKEVELYFFYRP